MGGNFWVVGEICIRERLSIIHCQSVAGACRYFRLSFWKHKPMGGLLVYLAARH